MNDVMAALREDLKRGTRIERQNALSRLGDLAPPGAAAWVIPVLSDAEQSVRVDAIVCLRELRDPVAIPGLIDVMTHGDTAEESEYAALALAAFTDPQVRVALLNALADPTRSNIVRMRVVLQLWRYPDAEVVEVLQAAVLNDRDRNVRSHAADSLLFIFRMWKSPAAWEQFWALAAQDPEIGVSEFAEKALRQLREGDGRAPRS